MGLKLEGMEQLLKQVEQMGKSVELVKEKALDEGAGHLREKLAENTPRSDRNKPHAADNVVIDKNQDERDIGYGHGHYYMEWVELGLKSRDIDPNPVVGRTFEQEKGNVQEKMANVIKREVGL